MEWRSSTTSSKFPGHCRKKVSEDTASGLARRRRSPTEAAANPKKQQQQQLSPSRGRRRWTGLDGGCRRLKLGLRKGAPNGGRTAGAEWCILHWDGRPRSKCTPALPVPATAPARGKPTELCCKLSLSAISGHSTFPTVHTILVLSRYLVY